MFSTLGELKVKLWESFGITVYRGYSPTLQLRVPYKPYYRTPIEHLENHRLLHPRQKKGVKDLRTMIVEMC